MLTLMSFSSEKQKYQHCDISSCCVLSLLWSIIYQGQFYNRTLCSFRPSATNQFTLMQLSLQRSKTVLEGLSQILDLNWAKKENSKY